MTKKLQAAKTAAGIMMTLSTGQRNTALAELKRILTMQQDEIITANKRDLAAASENGSPLHQRLKLDEDKLRQVCGGIQNMMELPDPVGRLLACTELDEQLILEKITVPIGVLGIVFEARPDVFPQIMALVLKSANAVLFKGGSEARHSAEAFENVIGLLQAACPFLPAAWATVLYTREDFLAMLDHPEYVDLIIPRGSNQLVQSIQQSTRIPVLGHADGVCHIYVHSFRDAATALAIIIDAKTQYPAACNSVETILVDQSLAVGFLPVLTAELKRHQVVIEHPDDWHCEYGDRRIAIKTVADSTAAIEHINSYSSHHTDAIISEDQEVADRFCQQVDSANVFVNCSTRFADGIRYGLGAEIGISTAKTHARG
ncbi:MAG: glutamate-5-semialdehyde dehydrogenase, partial [Spirochaetes bacterium]|nr:glutamate-5-semialdehyde dehydrogenase [Spirochaetota bacterium]